MRMRGNPQTLKLGPQSHLDSIVSPHHLSSLAVDPNTGDIWAKDFEGHITVISRGTITNKAEADIDISPDIASVFAPKPLSLPEQAVTVNTIYQNAPDPRAIAIDAKTGNVYVPCDPTYTYPLPYPDQVLVFNTLTNSLIATILLPATSTYTSNPWDVAIDSTTETVYVANASGATGGVWIIDEKTQSLTGYIPLGVSATAVSVDETSQKLFVASSGGKDVLVIDVKKGSSTRNTVLATIPLGVAPDGIAVDPVTGKVFTANIDANSISVIDEKSDTVTATISTGDYGPYKLAVDSAHGTLYVTNLLGGTTGAESTSGMVIEEATNSVTGNFLTFGESRALGVDSKRGFLYSGDGQPNSFAGVTVFTTNQ